MPSNGEVNASTVLAYAQEQGVQMVDLRFSDLHGLWHHISYPIAKLTPESFRDGFGMDGSAVRGWAAIHESDMLLIPDPRTYVLDPFTEVPTLGLIADVIDPVTRQRYDRDPRYIASKAEMYLAASGLADEAMFGAEAEFFIFDGVRYGQDATQAFYSISTGEACAGHGRGENAAGFRPYQRDGNFPVPPPDDYRELRTEMLVTMLECGLDIESHHHEVGIGGQGEIDMQYTTLLRAADAVQLYKYIVRNVARRHGKSATFMPKPLYQENGSSMHTHQSLWKDGKPLFAGEGYAGLSETALWYIGGLIKHGPALAALTAPTTNSYKRLSAALDAPVNLAYSRRNRSAACRIPMYSSAPEAKRVEYRPPDPSCNPYIAFSAMLMAGLDGIENRIDPGAPLDKDIYDLAPEELQRVPSIPDTLAGALDALSVDYQFLLKGDVFTEDLLETYMAYKREKEVNALRQRPHPFEFALYYDV
ncbi:MAG: type I glutamate--ammonia ligase [Acidobacteriota bacterium]|nr:type I glutamate--ammonia ligase [Acidobacteriota bacterium]